MDNGQTNQIDEKQPFFTEGVGNQSVEYTDNPGPTPWAEGNPSRDQNQNFGKNAINGQLVEKPEPVEFESFSPEKAPDFGPAPEMLQIEEIESAPDIPTDGANSYNESVIRIEGDSLDMKAVETIEDMERDFKKTGDAAALVDDFNRAKIALQENNNWDHLRGAA